MLHDTRGAILIPTALILVLLLTFVALAADTALGGLTQRRLQAAADAAVVAGLVAARGGQDESPVQVASAMLRGAGGAGTPEWSAADSGHMQVSIDAERPRLLAFIDGGRRIHVSAAAEIHAGKPLCLLALGPDTGNSPPWQGLDLRDCGALSPAMGETGNLLRDSDPWRDFLFPPTPPCAEFHATISGEASRAASAGGHHFCGGLSLRPGARLHLGPGTYAVSAGALDIADGARIDGAGVTILLYPGAALSVAAGAMLDLRAPADGLLFAAHPFNRAGVHLFANGDDRLEGSLHFPAQDLILSGVRSDCFQAVARTIAILQPLHLSNGCALLEPHRIRERRVRLIQ